MKEWSNPDAITNPDDHTNSDIPRTLNPDVGFGDKKKKKISRPKRTKVTIQCE